MPLRFACLTLAVMVVWVALEEVQQLVRADSIVSVAAVPVRDHIDPGWEKTHPTKRLKDARRAQIMVMSTGVQDAP